MRLKNKIYLLLVLVTSVIEAQNVQITYENPIAIEICGNEVIYKVTIMNNTGSDLDANSLLEVKLPEGIEYVDNTVSSNFNVDIANYNNPIFSANNIVANNEEIILQFNGLAKCTAYNLFDSNSGSVYNRIKYSYNIGGVNQPNVFLNGVSDFDMSVTDTYDLNFIDFDINIPAEVLGQPNQTLKFNNTYQTLKQQIDVNILGNSLSFSEFVLNVFSDSELDFIGVSDIIIDGISYNSSGINISDTYPIELTINALNIGLDNFNALMNISIIFDYKALSCFGGNSQHVIYESGMRCIDEGLCIRNSLIGDFEYEQNEPNLSLDFEIIDDEFNLCSDSASVSLTLINDINADGPAYNVYLLLLGNPGVQISNIVIDGVSVIGNDYVSPNGPGVLLQDGIFPNLHDLDGNGTVDLAPGSSISVTCDIEMSLPPYTNAYNPGFADIENCDSSYFMKYFYSNFYYNISECETINDISMMNVPSYLQWRDTPNNLPMLNFDTDIIDGELNHFQFCIDRKGEGTNNLLYDDGLMLKAQIELPCGVQIDETSIAFTDIDGNLLSIGVPEISIVNDKTIVNVALTEPYENISGDYGGCFEFDMQLNCDTQADCLNTNSILSATTYGYFSECPDQIMNLGCVEDELYMHCMPIIPSCPSPLALHATSFDATRMSYGTTLNGTQITIEEVDNGSFTGLNTKGAYACDTIRAEITGSTACIINEEDVAHAYIWYTHPENFSFLTMVGAEYDINGGLVSTTSSFSLRTDLSTSTKKVFEVQITGELINIGDILRVRGIYTVDKAINNTKLDTPNIVTDFPDVYNLVNFRGGLSLNSLPPPSPYHYGTDFQVYGLNYYGDLTGTQASCSSLGDFYVNFNVKGGSGDDFPNEFRNVIKIAGPVDISIPTVTNGSIDLLNAEYTVSGLSGSIPLIVQNQGEGVFRILDDFGTPIEYRPFDKVATTMSCSIRMRLALNDCSLESDQTIDVVASYLEQAYAEESCREEVELNIPTIIASSGSGFNEGDLSLDVVNPTLQSVNAVTRFKVNVNNTSLNNALFPWIKFTYPNGIISVANAPAPYGYDIVDTELVDIGETTTTLLLRLSAIEPGLSMHGYVDITLIDCEFTDQIIEIQIETGISCQVIPDNILEDASVLCSLDTNKRVDLEIVTSNLWMDVIPLFDTSTPINSCEEFQYLVQISNNELANIIDPFFQIDIPTGMFMSVQYRYYVTEIVDSAETFSNVGFSTPISISSGTPWLLEDINGILPGYTTNTSTVYNNYYQLLVTLRPICDYNGADKVYFTTNGLTNCNEEAYVPTFETTPNITGLESIPNYHPEISLEVVQNGDCGNYSAIIHYNSTTDISGSEGVLTINYPSILESNISSTSFILPDYGSAEYSFDFTIDSEYCEDLVFTVDTLLTTLLSCNGEECESSFLFQEVLPVNICCDLSNGCDFNLDVLYESVTDFDDECNKYKFLPIIEGEINLLYYNWLITNYITGEVIIEGSGEGIPEEAFVQNFTDTGVYKFCLMVTNESLGNEICEKRICTYIRIEEDCFDCDLEPNFEVIKGNCDIRLLNNTVIDDGDTIEYFWDLGDGSNSTEFEPYHSYELGGYYEVSLMVTVTSEDDVCRSTSELKTIYIQGCNQNEPVDLDMEVYPSTNSGVFTLDLGSGCDTCFVGVYNVLGQRVYGENVTTQVIEFDLSRQAKGVYLFRLSNGFNYKTKKVVLK